MDECLGKVVPAWLVRKPSTFFFFLPERNKYIKEKTFRVTNRHFGKKGKKKFFPSIEILQFLRILPETRGRWFFFLYSNIFISVNLCQIDSLFFSLSVAFGISKRIFMGWKPPLIETKKFPRIFSKLFRTYKFLGKGKERGCRADSRCCKIFLKRHQTNQSTSGLEFFESPTSKWRT